MNDLKDILKLIVWKSRSRCFPKFSILESLGMCSDMEIKMCIIIVNNTQCQITAVILPPIIVKYDAFYSIASYPQIHVKSLLNYRLRSIENTRTVLRPKFNETI